QNRTKESKEIQARFLGPAWTGFDSAWRNLARGVTASAVRSPPSPGGKRRLDLAEESRAALRLLVVHVVMREIVDPRPRRAVELHRSLEEAARRVAGQERRQPRAAVSADDAEPFDVEEARDIGAVRPEVEADARQKHLVDKPLEDRREPHVPHREREHEPLGGEQPVDIRGHAPTIDAHVVVLDPVLTAHDWVETFGVEVAVVYFVAALAQRLDRLGVQGGAKTGLERMGEEDEDAHGLPALRGAPSRRKAIRTISFPSGPLRPAEPLAREDIFTEPEPALRLAQERGRRLEPEPERRTGTRN